MNPKNTDVDTTKTITHIGLCAGYGGIELGLKRVIPNMRSVALCEIEAFACANLVGKMEAGLMDAAPIWSDLKTFPWAEFRGKVDILTGGYPCQPFSAAGKRAGKDDPRHLWPWIADGIRLLQPRCCFFENVEGHITLGLSKVISDLEEMGYRTTWGIFSASEVGAPHQRKRVFILADCNNGRGWENLKQEKLWPNRIEQSPSDLRRLAETKAEQGSLGTSETMADTRHMLKGQWPEPTQQEHSNTSDRGSTVGDSIAKGVERAHDHGESSRGIQPYTDQSGFIWPSRPGEPQHEWEPPRVVGNAKLQGLEGRAIGGDDHTEELAKGCAWEIKSSLGRDADGPADRMDDAKLQVTYDNRTDELRLLGNGVVPATAERAFRVLMAKL